MSVFAASSGIRAVFTGDSQANGRDVCTITVDLRDLDGDPVVGAVVMLSISPADVSDEVTYTDTTFSISDSAGVATMTVSTRLVGIKTFGVVVDDERIEGLVATAEFSLPDEQYLLEDPFISTAQSPLVTLQGREIELLAEADNNGAVTQIVWDGVQLLNSANKTRQLQERLNLDRENVTDFARLNEAGALSQAWADPSSGRYIGNVVNNREGQSQAFIPYDTPITVGGVQLDCSGNILAKNIYMDFLGSPHVFRIASRLDQFASTKQGALRWGLNLSVRQEFTKAYTYNPTVSAVPVEITGQGQVDTTQTKGIILAYADDSVAIGVFRVPRNDENSITSTISFAGAAEAGDPKFTNNFTQLLDIEGTPDSVGSSQGRHYNDRYIVVGTLTDVLTGFQLLTRFQIQEPIVGGVVRLDPVAFPSTVASGEVFNVTVQASILGGSADPNFTGPAVISALSSGSSLSGNVASEFVGGVATFTNLVLTGSGTQLLTFSSGKFSGQVAIVVGSLRPTLTAINPSESNTSAVTQTTITLTGTNFIPQSVARFGITRLATTFVNETTLTAIIPASLLNFGSFDITVANPPPGGGLSNSRTFTVVDGVAPVISNINIDSSPNQTTISWNTDEPATTELRYGIGNTNTTASSPGLKTAHVLNLPNLPAGEYVARVFAEDATGNRSEAGPINFSVNVVVPVQITNVRVDQVTSSSARLRFDTNVSTSAQVTYTPGGLNPPLSSGSVTQSHTFNLVGLDEDTTYSGSITATSPSGSFDQDTFSFTTVEGSGQSPVIVSGPNVSSITLAEATVSWQLNTPATGTVRFGTTSGNYTSSVSTGSTTTNQSVRLTGLASGQNYFYIVEGQSGPNQSYSSPERGFSTNVAPAQGALEVGDLVATVNLWTPDGKADASEYIAHVTIPLVDDADLNLQWEVDGEIVQREIVNYKPKEADGTTPINAVECIFKVTTPVGSTLRQQFTRDIIVSALPAPANLVPTIPGVCNLRMDFPGGSHSADILAASNQQVRREGHNCVTYRNYSRLTDGTDTTLGVHSYVTFYDPAVDPSVYVRLFISNSHVDPTESAANDYGVVGKIYFDELTLDASGITTTIVPRHDKYCMERVSGNVFKLIAFTDDADEAIHAFNDPERDLLPVSRSVDGVRQEIWPAGQQRIEHFVLRANGASVQVQQYNKAVLEYQNIGKPIAGRSSGNANRWFGPMYARSGTLPDTYRSENSNYPTAIGSDAYDLARMEQQAQTIKLLLTRNYLPFGENASYGHIIASNWAQVQEYGCWSPGFSRKGTEGGIYMMGMYETDYGPGHTKGWSYWIDQVMERHWITMFTDDGAFASVRDWQDANGGDMPFAVYTLTNENAMGYTPFFRVPRPKSVHTQPILFNNGTCGYDDDANGIRPFNQFQPIASTHTQRVMRAYHGLSLVAGDPMYRDLLTWEAQRELMAQDHNTSIGFSDSNDNGTVGQVIRDFSDPSRQNKGVYGTQYPYGRNKGWPQYTIAMMYMHTAPADTFGTGENIRQHIEDYAKALHDALALVMPGGPVPTYTNARTNRRVLQVGITDRGFIDSGAADLGATIYSYTSDGPLNNRFNGQTRVDGQLESGSIGTRQLVYLKPDPGGLSGQVGIYHPNNGERFPLNVQLGVYNGNPRDSNGNLIQSAENQVTLTSVIDDWFLRYAVFQTMEQFIQQHGFFSITEAVLQNVDPTRAEVMYTYVYEISKALADSEPYHLVFPVSGRQVGGYMARGSSGERGPFGTEAFRQINTLLEEPAEAPFISRYANSFERSYLFFGQMCAAYAAERLGVEPLSLTNSLVQEGLRLGAAPTETNFIAKIAALGDLAYRGTTSNVNELSYMWLPWVAEVQYQLTAAQNPDVAVGWNQTALTRLETVTGITTLNVVTKNGVAAQDEIRVSVTSSGTLSSSEFTVQPSPYIIPAGQSSVNVPITFNIDTSISTERTLILTLAIVAGSATLQDEVVTITIEDDGSGGAGDPLEVEFSSTSTNWREDSGDLSIMVRVSEPASFPITVPLTVGGTAQAADYTLIGAGPASNRAVTIPANQLQASFIFRPVPDTESDPGETVTFTLGSDLSYVLGTRSSITITLLDPAEAGDSFLLGRGIITDDGGGSSTYVGPKLYQTTVPATELSTVLPAYHMEYPDGTKYDCDVVGIDRNDNNEWLSYHIIGCFNDPNKEWSIPGESNNRAIKLVRGSVSELHPRAGVFQDSAFEDIDLEVKLANVSTPFVFVPGDETGQGGFLAKQVVIDGNYLRRTVYLGRLVDPNSNPSSRTNLQECMVCRMIVNERVDLPMATVDIMIENSAVDMDQDPSAPNPRMDGIVYFEYAIAKVRRMGYRLVQDVVRPTSGPFNGGSAGDDDWWLVKTQGAAGAGPNQEHGMLPGQYFCRRMVVFADFVGQGAAVEIARRRDFYYVLGPLGYQSGGWTEAGYYLPDFRNYPQMRFNNQTGLRALVAQGLDSEQQGINGIINNNLGGGGYGNVHFGWSRPGSVINPGESSENDISPLGFQSISFGGLYEGISFLDRSIERHGLASLNLATLRNPTDLELVQASETYTNRPPGIVPYAFTLFDGGLRNQLAWFWTDFDNGSLNTSWTTTGNWSLATRNLPWNNNTPGFSTFYLLRNQGINFHINSSGNWGPHKGTHASRFYRGIKTCIYLGNDEVAKIMLGHDASSRMFGNTRTGELEGNMSAVRNAVGRNQFGLRHMEDTQNNTVGRPDRLPNPGFGYAATGGASPSSSSRVFAQPWRGLAMWYSIADDVTRDMITDGGNKNPAVTKNLPFLISRYLDRCVNPAGILVASNNRQGSPPAYDVSPGTPNYSTREGAWPGPAGGPNSNGNPAFNDLFGNGMNNPEGNHHMYSHAQHTTYSFSLAVGFARIFPQATAEAAFIEKHLMLADVFSDATDGFVRDDPVNGGRGAWMNSLALNVNEGPDDIFNPILTEAQARNGGIYWLGDALMSPSNRNSGRYTYMCTLLAMYTGQGYGNTIKGMLRGYSADGGSPSIIRNIIIEQAFNDLNNGTSQWLRNDGGSPTLNYLIVALGYMDHIGFGQ